MLLAWVFFFCIKEPEVERYSAQKGAVSVGGTPPELTGGPANKHDTRKFRRSTAFTCGSL